MNRDRPDRPRRARHDGPDAAVPEAALDAEALRADDPLRQALHEAAATPPTDDVDWQALHARIRAAAQPTLGAVAAARSTQPVRVDEAVPGARPRVAAGPPEPAHVWQPLAGWSSLGIPLASAATVLLLLGGSLLGGTPTDTATPSAAFRTIEEEFASTLGYGASALLAGTVDEMLDAVLFLDGEDW